jgi:hypothetical protein
MRAPVGKGARIVCHSTKHFEVMTHWWKGGTGPCLREGCEACKAKREARWTGFFLGTDWATHNTHLVQFTDYDCEDLLKIEATTGTIRGCVVNLFRNVKRNNGSVSLRVEASRVDERHLFPEESILEILCRMWEVKIDGIHTETRSVVNGAMAQAVAENVVEQIKNSDDASWMLQRAQDLAGQRVLPLEAEMKTSHRGNGQAVVKK